MPKWQRIAIEFELMTLFARVGTKFLFKETL
jgi:hypothetical protein